MLHESGEYLVTIADLDKSEVTIRCDQEIRLEYHSYTLVIYPWFLYEKLKDAMESLLDSKDFFVQNVLTLSGKVPALKRPHPLHIEHAVLNASQ